MKTIGFAGIFYTLWDVSEPYQEYVNEYQSYTKQDFHYIQNLSKDLEKAKAKLNGSPYNVNLELKGESSFTTGGDVLNTPDDVASRGKYAGVKFSEIVDIDYLRWYYNNIEKPQPLKDILLVAGFVEDEDKSIVTKEQKAEYDKNRKRYDFIESLKLGYHFNDGDRVELELMQYESFGFDGIYGRCYVVKYASKCGKRFTYVGSSPTDISDSEYIKVLATIKHYDNTHEGHDDTKLLRIKIIK